MKKKLKIFFQIFLFIFPWVIRRRLLNLVLNYKIHKTAKIGFSIIIPDRLEMDEGSLILNRTFMNNIDYCKMSRFSKIGSKNWITGANTKIKTIFQYSSNRKCELIIGEHTRITAGHFIDCNGGVYIGGFTTIAGLKTQILSHSIDIRISRQTADPIIIGDYCFVSTACILLKNTILPDYSVLAAGAVLTKKFDAPYGLYAGNPAKLIKEYDKETTMYFHRTHGHVS